MSTRQHIDQTVQQRINDCAYPFVFTEVVWRFHESEGVLTLHGRVPSFYLKQVLQEMMRDIVHVERIVNHVDVVSATGLSSVRSQ